ncbi:7-beta-(4-carbaxybutanamido)cephalosporanic acid acylase [Sphingomonas taxi]|uniref:7-beta-(4-carbaxybutanamido)cephalosporanic acid acylase n=1 Tax=Sphingomonas taxi TaxID=1549858 RepID=A0A097EK86_9SPHN|nr:penicillin acylase family protein [Sphingomonas taxi]AIT07991.1 7-beta-(4-carbaxybutanamido)cephalosporanic acid acylase [Sphingomonas taxi]
MRATIIWAAALGLAAAAPAATPKGNAGGGEILWDTFGVPHVYAKTEAGAFWGFGYAQAQSHGNLLLKLFGEARGRAAEYWGGADNETQDRWLVANDVPTRAVTWFRQQTPQMRADLDAFAAGINAYAAAHPDAIAPAMRRVLPVSGTDVMAHAHRLMNYVYIASDRKVLADPTTNEAGGSNAWAVAPSRSASGKAMLLANPHLPWAPSMLTYYEAHLTAPGYSVYGATQVGLPVLRFAFNDDLGFTNTVNTMLGYSSYKLTLADGGYRYDGKVLPFTTAQKSYKVRQSDGRLKTVAFTQRYATQGPVFDLPNNTGTIALKVAGLDRPGVLQQYLDMGKAHDFAAFQRALGRMQVPMFNIVYADRAGHIMYIDNGILPRHADGDVPTWSKPVAGDTPATVWRDVHGYDDLPKVVDPASGFVQNANDPPWLATWPRQLDPKAFPAYVAPVGPVSQRAQHSVMLMTATPKLSFDDFVTRKLETRSLMADRLLPDLLAAAKGNKDPDIVAASALLASWDHRFEGDARGALLFETWAALFAPRNFVDQSNYAVKWTLDDPLATPRGLKDPAAAVAMLKAAAAKTRQLYGSLDRPFGEASRFHLGDVSVPGNGGFGNTGVFRTITWGPMKNGERTPVHGETWVSMIEFSTPMKAVGMMSYGNASQPGSKHNSDQLRFLTTKTFRTLWRDRAEVERHVEERTAF